MPETTSDALSLVEAYTYEIIEAVNFYGSQALAARYWSNRLEGELWSVTNGEKQRKALVNATQLIDNLAFAGAKPDGQSLEFPRVGQTDVPNEIVNATFELAMSLLRGIKPETEVRKMYHRSNYFGRAIRVDYDNGQSGQEWILAGIPCYEAWKFLRPFLSNNLLLKLRRG